MEWWHVALIIIFAPGILYLGFVTVFVILSIIGGALSAIVNLFSRGSALKIVLQQLKRAKNIHHVLIVLVPLSRLQIATIGKPCV